MGNFSLITVLRMGNEFVNNDKIPVYLSVVDSDLL